MATIRDKLGHSFPNMWRDIAFETPIPLSAKDRDGGDTHPAYPAEDWSQVRNRAANPTSIRLRRDQARDRNIAGNAEKTGLVSNLGGSVGRLCVSR